MPNDGCEGGPPLDPRRTIPDRRLVEGGEFLKGMAFLAGAVALLLLLSQRMPNVWHRMTAFYALMIPAAWLGLRLRWKNLLIPSVAKVAAGTAGAVVFYFLAGAGFRLIAAVDPPLAAGAAALYAWKEQVSAATAALLAVFLIIPGEEIVWRGAVDLTLAARFGPRAGVALGALAFAAAHAGFGSPLLVVAALACGTFWGWLTVRSGSLVPAIVCHAFWDLTVLFWLPY